VRCEIAVATEETILVPGERFREEFECEEHSVWLNTAHQGRLPKRAACALAEAVQWKLHPEMLASAERFTAVPTRLRTVLARLLGAREDEVVLANSASYGLHLIANGLQLGPGDQVLVAANDFPSDILPWLMLRDRGVEVRLVEPKDEVLGADEVEASLGDRTRVLCLTWVHSRLGTGGGSRCCRARLPRARPLVCGQRLAGGGSDADRPPNGAG
jgi:selenocysteine lyase/cysteine desulfurase